MSDDRPLIPAARAFLLQLAVLLYFCFCNWHVLNLGVFIFVLEVDSNLLKRSVRLELKVMQKGVAASRKIMELVMEGTAMPDNRVMVVDLCMNRTGSKFLLGRTLKCLK